MRGFSQPARLGWGSARRICLAAAWIGLGVVTAKADVWPVRFDTPEDSSSMAVTSDAYIADPLIVDLPALGEGPHEIVVERASLITYCSDPDGCTARVFHLSESAGGASAVRRLYLSGDGDGWIAKEVDETADVAGSLSDGHHVSLAVATTGVTSCRLREGPGAILPSYYLANSRAMGISNPYPDCTLRVYD